MATKIVECDLLVIGMGGIGSICAVKAAELTGKKVIVLEKTKKPGGATIFAHGISISDSTWQKNAGEKVNDPPALSGQFFDWLVSKGGAEEVFKYTTETSMVYQGSVIMPKRLEKYKDHDLPDIGPGWWGSYIVDKMMECCKKMDIPVLMETRAKKFLKDSNGKVSGVIADTREGELQVNFKACFIGAGGFGANYKKCQEVWPKLYNNIPMMNICPPSLTGDLIDAAGEIGAAIDLSSAFVNVSNPLHDPYSHSIFLMMMYPGMGLQITMEGERVTRGGGGTIMNEEQEPYLFSIADQDILEKAGEFAPTIANDTVDVPIAKRWREDVEMEATIDEKGRYGHHTKRANTLVELAMKMNIDPLVFLATVEKYNRECEENKKKNPQKDQNAGTGQQGGMSQNAAKGMAALAGISPMPVAKGPFYAFFGQRFCQCTHGGMVINENMEVFDAKGNVIPRLFAGGDCTTEYTLNTGSQGGGRSGQGGQGGSHGGQGGAPGGQGGQAPSGRQDGSGGQGGGGGRGGSPGLFGDYISRGGGGLNGIIKGYSAAMNIAKYLDKA
jgi:succinate dehydrogenase/fumarate reductase flavoprotein subunit